MVEIDLNVATQINCIKDGVPEKGKSWPQILAILIGCIGALVDGCLMAWPSPFSVLISEDKEKYNISEEESAYFTVLPPVGLILASLLFFNLNDVIGRKNTYILIAIPHLVSWIITMFTTDIYAFYASRLISGIGTAALFFSFPMYIGEVSTPKVRGTWGNFLSLSAFIGIFLMNVVGSYFDVRQTAYIFIFLPITFFILFAFMPESPYFYVMKGNYEQARKSLQFLHRKHNVESELAVLKSDVGRQMSESGTWKDLVTIRSNRKALLAGLFLRFFQQTSGIAIFTTYIQYIFVEAGGDVDPRTSAMLFSGVTCVLVLFGTGVLDKLGRKKAFMISSCFCGIILIALSIYFYLADYEPTVDLTLVNWFPLVGMLAFIFFYALGLAIVPTLMLGELFSGSIKSKGLCCLNISFGLCSFLSTNFFIFLNSITGLFGPFLVFGIFSIGCTVLTIYVVPETKGKTLEEIQQSLKLKQVD